MRARTASQEDVLAAARRALRPGISPEQAVVIGWAEVAGEPLDPEGFGDAAIILRAERLILDGLLVAEAVGTARAERATWGLPS